MKKILFLSIIVTSLISLFFTLGNLNQTFAIGENGSCTTYVDGSVSNGGCNTGLTCDTTYVSDAPNNCSGTGDRRHCTGICRKNCSYDIQSADNNTAQCSPGNEICQQTTTSGRLAIGYCIPNSSHHIPINSMCTREVVACHTDSQCSQTNTPEKQRGNCKDINAVCDVSANQPCTSGTCQYQGWCLPTTPYTCNTEFDSRQNITKLNCPPSFACTESSGKSIIYDVVEADGGKTHFENGICPDCQFTCRPTAMVTATCSCTNPGNPDSGKNQIVCQSSQKRVEVYCDDVGTACYSNDNAPTDYGDMEDKDINKLKGAFPGQTLTNFICRTPEEYQYYQNEQNGIKTIPPAPPCVDDLSKTNGECHNILTSFGIVATDPAGFISRLFGILLGAAGSIAIILFMRAGYRIMTARGNPEGIKEGREQIVAAIIGLMFLIFSFVILQVIGVDLLRLPDSPSSQGSNNNITGVEQVDKGTGQAEKKAGHVEKK